MSNHYEDWTDWAGDHPEQAEADLREEARKAERKAEHRRLSAQPIEDRDGADSAALYAAERKARLLVQVRQANCLHEYKDIDNQGVCEDCGIEVEGWEPDDAQMFTQFGTKDPRRMPA